MFTHIYTRSLTTTPFTPTSARYLQVQMMQAQVPAGISPGVQFQVQGGQQIVAGACPQGAGPGSMIQIQVPAAAPAAPAAPDPMAMFRAIDTDGSGSLAAAEIKGALSSGAMEFDAKTIRLMIAMFDQDRSGTINAQEFQGYVTCNTLIR